MASAKGARLVLKPRWTSCAILPLTYTTASLAMMLGPKAQALWYLVPKKYLLYLFIYFADSIVSILFPTHNLKTDFSLMQSKSIQTKSSIWTTRQSSSLADPLFKFLFLFCQIEIQNSIWILKRLQTDGRFWEINIESFCIRYQCSVCFRYFNF